MITIWYWRGKMLILWNLDLNTIRIKSSENKQQPGASRSGRSQWEEAILGSAVEKLEKFYTFFFIEGFPSYISEVYIILRTG